MDFISDEKLIAAQRNRYAVKLFKKAAIVPEKLWAALEESLVLTPSSYGLQPWKFIVVTDPALKTTLRAHSWHQSQTEDCSHYVIFCAREAIDEKWVNRYMDRISQVRGSPRESLAAFSKMILNDICGTRAKVAFEVNARQCYIALGNLITSAALLGVDTCPMEGFSNEHYDKLLKLEGTGWRTVVCCAVGYRSANDNFANLAKVRFPANEVVEHR